MDEYIGIIKYFGGNFAPRNYALCNGQLLAISSNTALFSILGISYGGNGSTTFGLPNLQGRAPVGAGQLSGGGNYTLGQTGGSENTTLTVSQMPVHTHPSSLQVAQTRATLQQPDAGGFLARSNDANLTDTPRIYAPANTTSSTPAVPFVSLGGLNIGTAGGSQPFPIRDPYQVINPIICIYGIFPSRN